MIKDPDLIDRQAVSNMLEEIADKGEAMRKSGEDDLAYRRRTAIANAARTLIESVNALPKAALTADAVSPPAIDSARAEESGWPEPVIVNPDIANPTGVPYFDCLLHRLLDAQQDINLYANEHMSQPLCDASALIDEVETAIRKLAAIRARNPVAAETDKGFDLVAHLIRQKAWSENTFGPGARTAGVVDHIRKELREIEAAPNDIEEWVDVIILAFDGAWRAGWKAQDVVAAMAAKQTKNEGRQWPDWRTSAPDKAIEHVRAASPSTDQQGGA